MNGIVAAVRRAAFLAPVGAALVLLVASSAGAAGSYRDPTGDGSGAPDITKVAVTSDAAGTITFDIGMVDLPSPADVQTYLFLDTDQNGATGAGEARDEAPDDGTWSYSLAAGGPEIRSVLVSNKPLLPKAGRTFTVTPIGVGLGSAGGIAVVPQPERYSCRATLAGKPIVGTGVGRCTWKLPKTARGRK